MLKGIFNQLKIVPIQRILFGKNLDKEDDNGFLTCYFLLFNS